MEKKTELHVNSGLQEHITTTISIGFYRVYFKKLKGWLQYNEFDFRQTTLDRKR
jgi:hypothetical protein